MELVAQPSKTPAHTLPNEWPIVPLASLMTFKNGVNANRSAYGSGVPFINVLEVITHHRLATEHIPGRISLPEQKISEYEVRTGDLLFNRTSETLNEVGLASVYVGEARVIFGGFVVRGRLVGKQMDSVYGSYALRAPSIRKQIIARGQGAVRANISQRALGDVLIALPSLREQLAIAEALSDADNAVATLDALIEKKRSIKAGAMQRLLTGRQRLPGFCGDWKETTMGDVLERCTSGATPYRGRPEFYKGSIPWVSSGELNYNVITDTVEHVTDEAVRSANLRLHPAGTFLMAITGLEAAGTRGACAMLGVPAVTNQSCMALYPKPILSTSYLFHYYCYKGEELAFRYCQGTKQQSYTARIVKQLPIHLPPRDEQDAIAAVLSDIDDEIAALDTRREKVAQVREGVMQELLTGRTRLV